MADPSEEGALQGGVVVEQYVEEHSVLADTLSIYRNC